MIYTPLANGIELIIFLFIVGSSIVSKLMQGKQEGRARPKPGAPKPKPAQTDVEREIQAFLQRTEQAKVKQQKGQRAGQRGGANRPPVPPPQRPRQRPTAGTARRESSVPPRRIAKSLSEKVGVDPFPENESVGQHVDRHMALSDRDAHLGDQIGLADERLEEHLHQAFDHSLGSLKKSDIETDDITEGTDSDVWARRDSSREFTSADRVREMLSNPQDIAAAFILSEIIKPPSETDPFEAW